MHIQLNSFCVKQQTCFRKSSVETAKWQDAEDKIFGRKSINENHKNFFWELNCFYSVIFWLLVVHMENSQGPNLRCLKWFGLSTVTTSFHKKKNKDKKGKKKEENLKTTRSCT